MITHVISRAGTVAREVDLTTFGRETERPSLRTLWITTDALGRIPHSLRPGSLTRLASELAGQSPPEQASFELTPAEH
jgi:hypothetical protein